MSHVLGLKSVDCLVFIGSNHRRFEDFSDWQRRYEAICSKWGEKVVDRKLESLADRGYIDYGTSARGGWLTEKGALKLLEYAQDAQGIRPQASPQVGKT